jgi:DNA primase
MRIPDTKIEEIRNTADIVDIISAYVQLKKRGKNYFGVCPFHQEKTPSFAVNEEKQIYHCFGCGAGGDVFKFLMEYKSISFIEAVQEIAEQLGIKIEYDQNISVEKQNEQETYYDINLRAAKYFSDNLLKNIAGEYARDYLTGRKLTEKTMRNFGLGFALPGWDNG